MVDVQNVLEKRAKGVVMLSFILTLGRLLSAMGLNFWCFIDGPRGPATSTAACLLCFFRMAFLNVKNGLHLREGVYKKRQDACERWLKAYSRFYTVLGVVPVLYCALAGVPLLKFLGDNFAADWLSWVMLASGDWIMVRVILQFRDKVLLHPPTPAQLNQNVN